MVPSNSADYKPKVHSFGPTDPIPTRSSRFADIPVSLRVVSHTRLRYYLRLLWRDRTARNGLVEEVIPFSNPCSALRLKARIERTPDRELVRSDLEASVVPKRERVTLEWLLYEAEQRERRDAAKRGDR